MEQDERPSFPKPVPRMTAGPYRRPASLAAVATPPKRVVTRPDPPLDAPPVQRVPAPLPPARSLPFYERAPRPLGAVLVAFGIAVFCVAMAERRTHLPATTSARVLAPVALLCGSWLLATGVPRETFSDEIAWWWKLVMLVLAIAGALIGLLWLALASTKGYALGQ